MVVYGETKTNKQCHTPLNQRTVVLTRGHKEYGDIAMRKVYENCAILTTPRYSLCLRVIFNVSPSRCVGMVLLA